MSTVSPGTAPPPPPGSLDAPTVVSPPAGSPDLTLRSTLPPPDTLAQTVVSQRDFSGSRRSSLMATLGGTTGPLPSRYEEGRVLGKGGMGVVVHAIDRDLARPVAVKKLPSDGPAAAEVGRFLREAQVTAQLEHPGVLPVHDVGVDERGSFYYVMRLVGGERTLRRVIDALKAGDAAAHAEFSFERRVEVIQQVARILDYAHARGVVHRDVKPDNIMLGEYGEVYLVDWGLAKVAGPAGAGEAPAAGPGPIQAPAASVDATQAGAVLGTPRYMSPEQANGEPATSRSDVYGLSAVLYEFLALRSHLGEATGTIEKALKAILTAEHLPAEVHYDATNGRVPRHLSLICERGLARRPEDRYPSARALAQDLQRWVEGWGPCVCPATVQLRLLTLMRRAIERHPFFTGTVTFAIPLALAVGFAIRWALDAFRH